MKTTFDIIKVEGGFLVRATEVIKTWYGKKLTQISFWNTYGSRFYDSHRAIDIAENCVFKDKQIAENALKLLTQILAASGAR